MVREQVKQLSELGPLPSSDTAGDEQLMHYESLISGIEKPVSDDEAKLLCELFGPDDCFGVAWTLIHLIETAPGWPLEECFQGTQNEWKQRLKHRWDRKVELEA